MMPPPMQKELKAKAAEMEKSKKASKVEHKEEPPEEPPKEGEQAGTEGTDVTPAATEKGKGGGGG